MEELKKVRLRPQMNGKFVLDAYNRLGYHIEREFCPREVETEIFTQDYLDIVFKSGRQYRVWFRDIDFTRLVIPMYVRGYRVESDCNHALYAVIAEVSYFQKGLSRKINRDYLLHKKEIARFYADLDVEVIIKVLLQAAGVEETS